MTKIRSILWYFCIFNARSLFVLSVKYWSTQFSYLFLWEVNYYSRICGSLWDTVTIYRRGRAYNFCSLVSETIYYERASVGIGSSNWSPIFLVQNLGWSKTIMEIINVIINALALARVHAILKFIIFLYLLLLRDYKTCPVVIVFLLN